MAKRLTGLGDSVPLSARRCRECGKRGMKEPPVGNDYKGRNRWLCHDCLTRYRHDYLQRTGKFMPNRLVDDMLRF